MITYARTFIYGKKLHLIIPTSKSSTIGAFILFNVFVFKLLYLMSYRLLFSFLFRSTYNKLSILG